MSGDDGVLYEYDGIQVIQIGPLHDPAYHGKWIADYGDHAGKEMLTSAKGLASEAVGAALTMRAVGRVEQYLAGTPSVTLEADLRRLAEVARSTV